MLRKLMISIATLAFAFSILAYHHGRSVEAQPGKTVIYRDEYGVPHIFAPTHEAGLYASGWAQAEDRLEEILKNYLRGKGEMAATFGGQGNFDEDVQARMWQFDEVAHRNYDKIMPEVRKGIEAFVDGINDYMEAHPNEVPAWWGKRKADKYMPVAFGRQYIYGWPAGQALGDLKNAGVSPNFTVDMRSSNEMAVAPSRSASGYAMLIIDPHLAWFGRQRFWELRLHAGPINASGFATAGVPYVGLGHSSDVAWAHTTGGPDTADIYELKLDPANSLRYKYDDGWRDLKARKVAISVKAEGRPREVTFYDSHYGPVVGRRNGNAYAAKLAYADEVNYIESKYLFNIARNYKDAITAMENGRVMPQNVMVADTDGNIYYQRTGRVPIRPKRPDGKDYDWTRPVDGSTSKTEWLGIHPGRDLLSILNPPQGYMQNCNTPPDVMMVNSPLQAEKFPFYLFNEQPHWTHQRGYSAVRWLEAHKKISVDDMQALALDMYSQQFDRWVKALTEADREFGADYRGDSDYRSGLEGIRTWDGYSRADSIGALKFYYWRNTLMSAMTSGGYSDLVGKINDYLDVFGWSRQASPVSASEQRQLLSALAAGMKRMRANHGSLDIPFGTVFRVGREDNSWPVGGGSLLPEGIGTIRSVGFSPERPDHTRWGDRGQTSTEVVVLSKPIKSFTQPPIGESDRPDSPHFRDQAEKLFSPGKMKPSWFAKEELMNGHVKSTEEIVWPRRKAAGGRE